MLTGDGGDKTLAYLFPGRNLLYNNPVKNILQKNEIGSSAACKILFGFDTENMENEMIGKLRSYGYSDARWNYKHFLIYERTKNWLFEGEDRNRSYIWSTSPFYHPDFFKTVHSIDEKEKKDFKLYQAFLNKIAPELNDIINANWGFAINETKRLRSFLLKQTLKQEVKRILPIIKIRTLATQEILSEVNRLIRQQHTEQALFKNKFEIKSLSQEELFHFLTLLKVSEAMEA
jgi:hypothetical protein